VFETKVAGFASRVSAIRRGLGFAEAIERLIRALAGQAIQRLLDG
jgi:hypothetical protein